MSVSEAKAAIIGDRCHVAEGPMLSKKAFFQVVFLGRKFELWV
jgi:hypothetical protein